MHVQYQSMLGVLTGLQVGEAAEGARLAAVGDHPGRVTAAVPTVPPPITVRVHAEVVPAHWKGK